MKILSIITMDRAAFERGPSPATRERMEALYAQMKKEGVLLETGGKCEAELELTVARKNGTYSVTDGPFAEAKESSAASGCWTSPAETKRSKSRVAFSTISTTTQPVISTK